MLRDPLQIIILPNPKKLPEFGAILENLKRSPLFFWRQKTPKNGKTWQATTLKITLQSSNR